VPAQFPNLEIYPTCVDGVWETNVLGWALFLREGHQKEWRAATEAKSLNAMDHEGTIVSASMDGNAIALKIAMTVNPDPWVKGGRGEYTVNLTRDGDKVAGTYTGTFEGMEVKGAARGKVRLGRWPAPVPGYVPLKPGEHPRLMFRASDLPALREKAKTADGKAMLALLEQQLKG